MPQTTAQPYFPKHTYERFNKSKWALIETTSLAPVKPKQAKIDLMDVGQRALIVAEFCNVTDLQTFLDYVVQFGLPTRTDAPKWERLGTQNLRSRKPERLLIPVPDFLALAAMIRWLICILKAIDKNDPKSPNHELLESWIQAERSSFQYSLFEADPEPAMTLKMRPKPKSKGYTDWKDAEKRLAKQPEQQVPLAKWNKTPLRNKLRFDFAREYLAFQINQLIQNVCPAVTPDGKPYFVLTESLEAIGLNLYDQFTGAAGIGICRNTDCPNKFYVKRKGKRSPRSDQKYCYKSACQKRARKNQGRIRNYKERGKKNES